MSWLYALEAPRFAAALFTIILVADVLVWAGTKGAFKLSARTRTDLIDRVMRALGSPAAFLIMGIVSIGVAWWDGTHHIAKEGLDLSISIWTMLMDVIILIGANYNRERDRQLMEDIRKDQLHDQVTLRAILKHLNQIHPLDD